MSRQLKLVGVAVLIGEWVCALRAYVNAEGCLRVGCVCVLLDGNTNGPKLSQRYCSQVRKLVYRIDCCQCDRMESREQCWWTKEGRSWWMCEGQRVGREEGCEERGGGGAMDAKNSG